MPNHVIVRCNRNLLKFWTGIGVGWGAGWGRVGVLGLVHLLLFLLGALLLSIAALLLVQVVHCGPQVPNTDHLPSCLLLRHFVEVWPLLHPRGEFPG